MFGIRKRSRTEGSSALRRRSDHDGGAPAQPRGPDGPLERRPLEDRDVRLGCLRRRRVRARGNGQHEDHRPERVRSGRVRPDGQDPRGRLQAARGRERPDSESHPSHDRSRIPGGDRGRRLGRLGAARRPACPLAARARQRGPDREGRSCGARRAPDPRRRRQGKREDRCGRRPGRRGTAGPPAALHRRVRQRQRGQRVGHRVRRGPREGGAVLAADHVDHPRGRVRGARRGGHSAAPRPDRGVRDVRAGRRRQPGDAARRGVGRARPADRARRWRRLLDVLLEARTRGTGRRTQ